MEWETKFQGHLTSFCFIYNLYEKEPNIYINKIDYFIYWLVGYIINLLVRPLLY